MNVSDCGHRCCDIRSNPAHSHSQEPGDCPPCQHALDDVNPFEQIAAARQTLNEARKK